MNRTRIKWLFEHILNAPLLMWVLLGFSMSYLLFFVYPILFSSQVMQFFKYVPAMEPIGIDLKSTLNTTQSWFAAQQSPYIGNNKYAYPPFTSVLVMPFLFVNLSLAYKIVTLVNVFCYVMITFVFPLMTGKESQVSPLLMLIFITGLFSYGFQFELERGQFNVIAIFMCFLAIWIYHYHNRYRCWAYFLFTISVQIKVFPFIFIVMLISDWRDWKNNIKRFLLLAALNFAFLFVLGPKLFVDFINAIKDHTENAYIWIGNHSIRSFVTLSFKFAYDQGWVWVNQDSGLTQIALLAFIVGCIFLIMLQTFRQKQTGINPLLLLACTIGALVIPSASHDYTLSILAAPVAILFNYKFWERANSPQLKIIFIVPLLIFSAAYSSTLFSFTNKPLILENNFPALVTMLLAITFLSLVSKPSLESKGSEQKVTAYLQEVAAEVAPLRCGTQRKLTVKLSEG